MWLGSVMESKLAFAVGPTGLRNTFARLGFARANFGFVILDKIKTNICFKKGDDTVKTQKNVPL